MKPFHLFAASLFVSGGQPTLKRTNVLGLIGLSIKAWTTAGMLLWPGLISGQSVVTTGAVNPSPVESPVWNIGGDLSVGYWSEGTLTILDGGKVSNLYGYIGRGYDSIDGIGTVTVKGVGSTWTNTYGIYVGHVGHGTLTISDGGKVSNLNGYSFLGYAYHDTGTATVDGEGSAWINASHLYIGRQGSGELTISNGGKVSNTYGYIGRAYGLTSRVTVDGAGSTWTNSAELHVGFEGAGTLTILNGGKVSNTTGYIGDAVRFKSSAMVDGAGSTWTNSASLSIGIYNEGELTISGGGKVTNTLGYIGKYDNSIWSRGVGSVEVSGSQSTWTNTGALRVGAGGKGTLLVEDGGRVTATAVVIADESTSEGKVTISGVGSTLAMVEGGSGAFYVGNKSAGELRIEDGGRVSNATGFIGTEDGSAGTATVTGEGSRWENSGDLILAGNSLTTGTTGSGTLMIAGGGTVSVGGTTRAHSNGTIQLEEGGTLRTQHLDITDGAFYFYQGGILIVDGTVTGDLDVPELGLLSGTPTVTGNLTVAGALSPGNSTGLLTVEGNLILDSTAWTTLELASLTDFDRIAVSGDLIFGGTLFLVFIDGFVPTVGDDFALFTVGYAWDEDTTFANIEFSTIGYTGIFNYETGMLNITAVPEPSVYGLMIAAFVVLALLRHPRMA